MYDQAVVIAAAVFAIGLCGCASAGPVGVSGIVIDTDRSVNCATVETIVADVCRDCKTDQTKAVALYDFMVRMVWMPHVYGQPKEMIRGRLASVRDPLKVLNVYGAAGCDMQADVFCTLAAAAGLRARRLDPGFAHGSNEIGWGGKWHWMDVWLPCFLLDEQGEIFSYDALMANRGLIDKAVAAGRTSSNWMFNPGPDLKTVKNASPHRAHAEGSGVKKCTYVEDLSLRPGESVTWLWDNVGKWYWPGEPYAFPAFKFPSAANCKQAFPYWEPYKEVLQGGPHPWNNTHYRYYGNAVFVTAAAMTKRGLADLGATLTNVSDGDGGLRPADPTRDAIVEIGFNLPYAIADSEVAGDIRCAPGGSAVLEYSLDGGKAWKVARQLTESGRFGPVSLGKPNAREFPAGTTSGQYGYRLRITLRPGKGVGVLKDLKVTNTTMLNFYSRPWLEVGDNNVTVTCKDGKALARTPLEITWKWLEDWTDEKSFTHKVAKSGATCVINVGGAKRPKMKSITIACPNR